MAPHRLIGSGTVRRCGFVGVGVVLMEEVCLSLFLLPLDLDVELPVTSPAPCVLHASHHGDYGLSLEL